MAKHQQIFADHKLTPAEKSRRFQDNFCSIDKELEERYLKIDWDRRNTAEKDLVEWTNTYLIGLTLDESPSEKGEEVLR